MDPAGHADAHTFKRLAGKAVAHGLHAVADGRHRSLGIRKDPDILMREKASVQVQNGEDGSRRTDVRHQDHQIVIERKKGRASSARTPHQGSFHHPLLLQQLLHDVGHGAGLEPGRPRKIRSRDRLPRTHNLKNNVPVDVPCNLTRSEFDVGQIASFCRRPVDLFFGLCRHRYWFTPLARYPPSTATI